MSLCGPLGIVSAKMPQRSLYFSYDRLLRQFLESLDPQMAKRRLFERLCESNKDLALALGRICDEAAEIWKSQNLREFTVHGGPHYSQVEANLDSLTINLEASTHPLSPEEIFVLIAACHLHDIGMQLGVPDAREKHAQYAYELILNSSVWVGPEHRKVTLPIQDWNARTAIA